MPPLSKSPGFKAPFKSPFPYSGTPKKTPSGQLQTIARSGQAKSNNESLSAGVVDGANEQRVMKIIPTPAGSPNRLNQPPKAFAAPLQSSKKKGKAAFQKPVSDQTTQTPDSWKAVHEALWERVSQNLAQLGMKPQQKMTMDEIKFTCDRLSAEIKKDRERIDALSDKLL